MESCVAFVPYIQLKYNGPLSSSDIKKSYTVVQARKGDTQTKNKKTQSTTIPLDVVCSSTISSTANDSSFHSHNSLIYHNVPNRKYYNLRSKGSMATSTDCSSIHIQIFDPLNRRHERRWHRDRRSQQYVKSTQIHHRAEPFTLLQVWRWATRLLLMALKCNTHYCNCNYAVSELDATTVSHHQVIPTLS